MSELEFHKVEDAAKAAGVAPATLRRWLNEDRHDVKGPPGGVITRKQLRDTLKKRGRWLPDTLDPWPKLLVIEPSARESDRVYAALETELPESAVSIVLGADDALAAARDFRPQLAILDSAVAGSLRLCQSLADDQTPVLIIAPQGDVEAGKAALEAGAKEVLHKPLTPGLLAETVRRILHAPAPAPTA